MVYRMARPTKRSDSRVAQFERHVPADVQALANGRTVRIELSPAFGEADPLGVTVAVRGDRVRFSLRTDERALLARRHAEAQAALEAFFEGLRRGPVRLTHKQNVALSGEVYRRVVQRFEDDPLTPEEWMAFKGLTRAALEGRLTDPPVAYPDAPPDAGEALALFGEALTDGINALPRDPAAIRPALEKRFGAMADEVLAQHGLLADDLSRFALLRQVALASIGAGETLKRYARGDYSPDTRAAQFPPVEAANPRTPGLTFDALADAWERAKGIAARPTKTVRDYRRVATVTFPNFLRQRASHDDPCRVTQEDIHAWIYAMQEEGLTQKTIRDSRFAVLRTFFKLGVKRRWLAVDPTDDVNVVVGKRRAGRERGFTPDEARSILTATRSLTRGKRSPHLMAAIRWVPWICAYTGCRTTEACQLRKEDFSQRRGGWWIRITPDAGSTKTDDMRDVPVHSALEAEGLLDFVAQSARGPLFYRTESGAVSVASANSIGAKVGRWVRSEVGITDPRVQPNYGWRHAFKTQAREVGMDQEARNYIQGHFTPGAGAEYGDMAGLPAQMERLPRWL